MKNEKSQCVRSEELVMIQSLIARGALFVANNSGGKDSQAMLIAIRALVPAAQILVIHAELPGVEWKGTEEHARAISSGLEYRTCTAVKTFFQMVDRRQNWPSPSYRQCTSDLKRGPIERTIRQFIAEKGLSGLVVNCMGLRAEESTNRDCGLDKAAFKSTGARVTLKKNERNSKAGREWYDWLPIHGFTISDVWLTIKKAGQSPHWAYASGMSRLSCCFCIMSSKADLQIAARLNPELYARYVAKEREIGKTLFARKISGQAKVQPVSLEEHVGIQASAAGQEVA
jgi:DNA sulfur modification protein DndC